MSVSPQKTPLNVEREQEFQSTFASVAHRNVAVVKQHGIAHNAQSEPRAATVARTSFRNTVEALSLIHI